MFLSKTKILLITLIASMPVLHAEAQNACNGTTAYDVQTCARSEIAVGTQTNIGETFTWYQGERRVRGPLSGNGSAISFNFAVERSEDAGLYTIEKSVNGSAPACANKINAILVPLADTQIMTGGGYSCGNSVLRLQNTQVGVTYFLYNEFRYVGYYNGTGGPVEMIPDGDGTYYVEASYDGACHYSYNRFGSETIKTYPELLQVLSFTNTSATVQWSGSGNYLIEYGPAGFTPGWSSAPGTNGTIIHATQSIVTIPGLIAGRNYDVYARAMCPSGDYSANSQAVNFSTTCSNAATLPVIEGFENVTAGALLPSCWSRLNFSFDLYDPDRIITEGARTGTNCLQLSIDSAYTLLPKINATGNQRLRYFVKLDYGRAVYEIRYSNGATDANAFNNILLRDTVYKTNGYIQKDITLSGITGPVILALKNIEGYMLMDDVTIENIPLCAGAAMPVISGIGNNSVQLNWRGAGNFIVEYGAPGFTPGTAASAGAGGSIVTTSNNFITISSLLANTAYDVYIRQNCTTGPGGFSTNSGKLNFTTYLNCATAVPLSLCTNTTATFAAGTGAFHYPGNYPYNSCGIESSGKQVLYSFTPAVTGIYYLDILTSNATINHFYKTAASGCSNTGWTGIHTPFQGILGKIAIGSLTAGTNYYILFVNNYTSATSQAFKICRADVRTSPSCVPLYIRNAVPAKSTKKEYLLDEDGGLVAELDFSQVTTNLTNPGYSDDNEGYRGIHTGNIRRDFAGKEYLDRSFSFEGKDSVKGTLGIKFYFRNSELTSLINEPNDGTADVASINDLRVSTFSNTDPCTSVLNGLGVIRNQQTNAAYDANSSYVQFNHAIAGKQFSVFLHGGNTPLNGDTASDNTPVVVSICPGSNASLTSMDEGPGFSYQWQVNNGSGYINITNDSIYGGNTSRNLYIMNPRTSMYGHKYRCIATNGNTSITGKEHILKFSLYWSGYNSGDWRDPANWNCSSSYSTPDANTDVYVNCCSYNDLYITTNVSCRSLNVADSETVEIQNGASVTITGK